MQKILNIQLTTCFKKEDGQIKRVDKAIELFETENNDSCNTEKAIILRNINKENKNLTVYLYKKASNLQKMSYNKV